jgi:hypothetical protein
MYSDFSPPFQRSKVAASKQWRPPHRLICLDLVADGRQVTLFISSERSLASADEEDAGPPDRPPRRCSRLQLALVGSSDVLDVVGISGDERDHPFRLGHRQDAAGAAAPIVSTDHRLGDRKRIERRQEIGGERGLLAERGVSAEACRSVAAE